MVQVDLIIIIHVCLYINMRMGNGKIHRSGIGVIIVSLPRIFIAILEVIIFAHGTRMVKVKYPILIIVEMLIDILESMAYFGLMLDMEATQIMLAMLVPH